MREIKFRGKAIMTKEKLDELGIKHYNGWVTGNLIIDGDIAFIVGGIVECDAEYIVYEWWVEVDIETVGQYTGLKDKNSKEIYEGYIVHCKSEIEQLGHFLIHEQVGEIKIDKGMTGFKGKTKQIFKDEINIHDSKFLFLSSDIYEVIGNIYENPELMEIKSNEENISTKTRIGIG